MFAETPLQVLQWLVIRLSVLFAFGLLGMFKIQNGTLQPTGLGIAIRQLQQNFAPWFSPNMAQLVLTISSPFLFIVRNLDEDICSVASLATLIVCATLMIPAHKCQARNQICRVLFSVHGMAAFLLSFLHCIVLYCLVHTACFGRSSKVS
jgi:hypothetical protein